METGEIAATHEEEHAPLTLWAALVFAAVLPIYLVAPGGDVAKTPIISTLFLVLIAFFLVVRRSRIAWWLLMINLVLRLLADATSGVVDTYVAVVVVSCLGAVVTLLLRPSREWVRLWR